MNNGGDLSEDVLPRKSPQFKKRISAAKGTVAAKMATHPFVFEP